MNRETAAWSSPLIYTPVGGQTQQQHDHHRWSTHRLAARPNSSMIITADLHTGWRPDPTAAWSSPLIYTPVGGQTQQQHDHHRYLHTGWRPDSQAAWVNNNRKKREKKTRKEKKKKKVTSNIQQWIFAVVLFTTFSRAVSRFMGEAMFCFGWASLAVLYRLFSIHGRGHVLLWLSELNTAKLAQPKQNKASPCIERLHVKKLWIRQQQGLYVQFTIVDGSYSQKYQQTTNKCSHTNHAHSSNRLFVLTVSPLLYKVVKNMRMFWSNITLLWTDMKWNISWLIDGECFVLSDELKHSFQPFVCYDHEWIRTQRHINKAYVNFICLFLRKKEKEPPPPPPKKKWRRRGGGGGGRGEGERERKKKVIVVCWFDNSVRCAVSSDARSRISLRPS